MKGELIFECVHGEVELFVLFFACVGGVLPHCAFKYDKFIFEGVDFVEICLALFLWEFVDLVEEEAEVVEAFADARGKGLDVHCLKNGCYNFELYSER